MVEISVGQKFGRWTIIDGPHWRQGKNRRHRTYLCHCQCGNEREVSANSLQQGKSQSCGCLQTDSIRKGKDHPMYRHGHCMGERTKEWRAWNAMIRRCTYKSMNDYERYGGRGIKVCKRWLKSFESFLHDVGNAPTPNHSLDRINNNGNYEPGNVRWATNSEQIKNSRKARPLTFHGRTQLIGEWADELGIKRTTIQMRIDHYGWSVEKALTTPAKS